MNVLQVHISDENWIYSLQLQDEEIAKISTVLNKKPENEIEHQVHTDYDLQEGRVYRKVNNQIKLFLPKGVRNRVLRYSHD